MLPIQTYIDHFIKVWENSPNECPKFRRAFSEIEKTLRESNYDNFQNNLKALQSHKKVRKLRTNPGKSFFPMFKSFLSDVFDFDEQHLEIIMSDDFKAVSKDFFYKARAFGPELQPENIYQGMRNVWIMNGLQLVMGVPVKISPSVFAYSMIYPYSDNLLDDLNISTHEKQQFSKRFNQRLHGENVKPRGFEEEQLFKLVAMFEKEFDRKQFPSVYDSLYAIQQGQTNSLKMIGQNGISNADILNICFEKGGASVLADGYLVAGKMTPEQEQALFGYGVYLQLLDDIQDIKEDCKAETKTMFSFLDKNDLGLCINQTINFGRATLKEMHCFEGTADGVFLELMNRSIETMIIESVGLNNECYTSEYLREIEQYSPLHFDFVRNKKAQSKSQRFAMFQKYFSQPSKEPVSFV